MVIVQVEIAQVGIDRIVLVVIARVQTGQIVPGTATGLESIDRIVLAGYADRNRPNFRDRERGRWNTHSRINDRPNWANIDNSTNINIYNRWNNAFVNSNRGNWWNASGNRRGYWNGWGDGVRDSWRNYGDHGRWFGDGWWDNHYHDLGGWHYHYHDHNQGWNYWWSVPARGSGSQIGSLGRSPTTWSQPVYYDYGSDGNVTYQDNSVYIGGTQVATTDEFAASAMDLATVAPPESEEQATEAEWMPLGTFAVSMNEKDVHPSMTMQLAVNKQGIVSGTLYNIDTDQAQTIQGQVDKGTQRTAFRIGNSDDLVAETGLYNLTQSEAPLLVHFGPDRVENYLLVRLEQSEESAE